MKGLKDLLNKYVEIKRIGKYGKFVVLNTNINTLEKEINKLLTLHSVGCSKIIDYEIINEEGELIKEGKEDFFWLNKGDAIIVNDIVYGVENKHLDYDKKIWTLYVETD